MQHKCCEIVRALAKPSASLCRLYRYGGSAWLQCLRWRDRWTPLVAVRLVGRTADELAPAYLIMVAAAVSFFATWDAGRTSVRLPAQSPASKAKTRTFRNFIFSRFSETFARSSGDKDGRRVYTCVDLFASGTVLINRTDTGLDHPGDFSIGVAERSQLLLRPMVE